MSWVLLYSNINRVTIGFEDGDGNRIRKVQIENCEECAGFCRYFQ